MFISSVSHDSITKNSAPASKINFGFRPTKQQGQIFRYLKDNAPDYASWVEKNMMASMQGTKTASDIRDSYMYRGLAKGCSIKAGEAKGIGSLGLHFDSLRYALSAKRMDLKVYVANSTASSSANKLVETALGGSLVTLGLKLKSYAEIFMSNFS